MKIILRDISAGCRIPLKCKSEKLYYVDKSMLTPHHHTYCTLPGLKQLPPKKSHTLWYFIGPSFDNGTVLKSF